jgi:hypothetical protein
MIFYFFPLGISSLKLRHVWIAQVFTWMLMYRFLMSLFFPELQVTILAFLSDVSFSVETATVLFQSLITPISHPDKLGVEHSFLTMVASLFVIFFWILYGSSLEHRLGWRGFLGLMGVGFLLAVAIPALPFMTLNPVYWIGKGLTLFFMGVTLTLFVQEDVRIFYHGVSVFGGHHQGTWDLPAPLLSAFLGFIMALSASIYWYPEDKPVDALLRYAQVAPVAWLTALIVTGALVGYAWGQAFPNVEEEQKVLGRV